MTTTLAQTPNHAPASEESQHWDEGRLVVQSSGSDAGAMRLDLDLPGFDSADEVIHHVHLMIPGEPSPLSPFDAVGQDGRFIMSFFSADIASGELPQSATVGWSGIGSQMRVKAVPVECATLASAEASVCRSTVSSVASTPSVNFTRQWIAVVAIATALLTVFIL